MSWQGGDGVTVKAWKGDIGGTLLKTAGPLYHGDEITVSGMGGSPNDQVWEIFYNGVKAGESKFHISCSDSNMNGPEDCGLPAGDGKSDELSLLVVYSIHPDPE